MEEHFLEGETVVFWDVNDFRIRTSTGRSYLETLRSALGSNGYYGKLKITAYGEKKPRNLGHGVTFGKYARLNRMLLDMALWALDTSNFILTRYNVMVIAENMDNETEMDSVSYNLRTNSCNVLVVLPDDYEEKIKRVKLPSATFMWTWQDLLAGKEPITPTAFI